ncbi:MAG: MaoC/PaaZ C-terminal domain-containing protein [Minwuia sp.]|nr:MaoC/PaaZ C-terminal domain-containing protein [Minwuia sp.]
MTGPKMPISSARVGEVLGECETEMTPRRMLAYAAGLLLGDDVYLDDARPGGVEMMPAMCAAVEWPLSDGAATSECLGITLAQYRSVGVHAEQDSIFHRPPRMGERLRTSGVLETLKQTRAGILMTCRYDTVDSDGQPVFTSYNSGMFRGWRLDCDHAGISTRAALPQVALDGESASSDAIAVPRYLPHVYSEGGPIWNPIHTERVVALAADLPDIILHGTATWALAMDSVIRRCADGDPRRLKRFACRFSGMVIPGETITVRHRDLGDGRIEVDTVDARGKPVLSNGIAEILAD